VIAKEYSRAGGVVYNFRWTLDAALFSERTPILRLMLLSSLTLAGCSSEQIRFNESLSVPGCVALPPAENAPRGQEALEFFRREVGGTFPELSIDHGVVCDGEEIFTFNIWTEKVPSGPFFVRRDLKTGERKLGRPE
jgi:hypothetical protein